MVQACSTANPCLQAPRNCDFVYQSFPQFPPPIPAAIPRMPHPVNSALPEWFFPLWQGSPSEEVHCIVAWSPWCLLSQDLFQPGGIQVTGGHCRAGDGWFSPQQKGTVAGGGMQNRQNQKRKGVQQFHRLLSCFTQHQSYRHFCGAQNVGSVASKTS